MVVLVSGSIMMEAAIEGGVLRKAGGSLPSMLRFRCATDNEKSKAVFATSPTTDREGWTSVGGNTANSKWQQFPQNSATSTVMDPDGNVHFSLLHGWIQGFSDQAAGECEWTHLLLLYYSLLLMVDPPPIVVTRNSHQTFAINCCLPILFLIRYEPWNDRTFHLSIAFSSTIF